MSHTDHPHTLHCLTCGNPVIIADLHDEDLWNELTQQADALGLESLTENEQCYVDRRCYCSDACFHEAD